MSRRMPSKRGAKRVTRKSVTAIVRREIASQQEVKYRDIFGAGGNVYAGSSVTFDTFFSCAQGIQVNQRIGEECYAIRHQLNVSVIVTAGQTNRVRLMYILPDMSEAVSGALPSTKFDSLVPGNFLPRDTTFKYRVLKDVTIHFNPQNGSDRGQRMIQWNIPMNHKVRWDGTGADPVAGDPFLVATSDQGSVGTNVVSVELHSRFTFRDA